MFHVKHFGAAPVMFHVKHFLARSDRACKITAKKSVFKYLLLKGCLV
jgi:hypothetical protein